VKTWALTLLLFALPALGQNLRFDFQASTTTGAGNLVPVLAIPGAGISFYTGCTTLPCSNLATTFASVSGGTQCPSNAQAVWQLPLSQTCTSVADSQGNFGGYFQGGTYEFTETVSGKTFGPYLFTVGTTTSGQTPQQFGSSYYFASGFPSSCNVGGTAYTTQLDCAWRTALAATTSINTIVIVEPGVSYTTCAGLPMIRPGATGSFSVGLMAWGENAGHNSGGFSPDNAATITQSCAISTGTVSLPEVSGSAFKQLVVKGVTIDANHLAPYALQVVGQNESSIFRDIQVANGTTGPAVLGTAFDFTNGFTVNATLDNWQVVDNCGVTNGCGGGGAVTVSLSGGVPSFTVTAPGSNYDSNTIATLVGYQNGTRNNPCNTVGVTTPVISGGHLTGVTSTATGCSGTVYVQLTDERKPTYGLDIENMTDSRATGLDIRTGAVAGLYCQSCGSDVFTGVHPWGQGLFGIKSNSFATFVGTDCGEVSLACFDNATTFAKTIAVGTMYNSGTQFQGFSLFRNEFSTSTYKIFGVTCQSTQTAEYHTLANVFGVIDTNAEATTVNTLGNSLKDAEYCGSGTGETLNVIPGNGTILGNYKVVGTPTMGPTITFALNSTPFVDCTATGFQFPPTISGSVVTFPSNGTDNSGSIACTDFHGRITLQSIPNSGTPTAPQTFDLTTQFAVSTATYIQLDPTFGSGFVFINAPSGLAVQGGGNITVSSPVLIKSSVSLTNGAASGAGTITNAPTAGNPTKWIPIVDNGTTRFIPAW
jgi:hypothetical protein